jgi:hypothetical protein
MLLYTDAYLHYALPMLYTLCLTHTVQEVVTGSVGADMRRDNSAVDDAPAANGYADVNVEVPLGAGLAATPSEPTVEVSDTSTVRTVRHCTPCCATATNVEATLQRQLTL